LQAVSAMKEPESRIADIFESFYSSPVSPNS
jgi:hypothetical protein